MQRIDGLRECAERRLRVDVDGELIFLQLIELHDQPAFTGVCARLDFPREHLLAGHARDFARAAQEQRYAVEFALHDFAIEQRELAHEAGADADLREHFRCVEKFSFGLRRGGFPREFYGAVRRQEACEVCARTLRAGGAGELKLRVSWQPVQDDRLQRAGRDTEIDGVPGAVLSDGGVEFEGERKVAGLVESDHVTPVGGGEVPVGMLREFGRCEAAGEDAERAAFRSSTRALWP